MIRKSTLLSFQRQFTALASLLLALCICITAPQALSAREAAFLSTLNALKSVRAGKAWRDPFNDTDSDGIADAYDADDDGDGIIDELDVDPLDPNVRELVTIKPWINQIHYQDYSGNGEMLSIEIVKLASDSCDHFYLRPYDETGKILEPLWLEGYEDCRIERMNGYAIFHSSFNSERWQPRDFGGIYLEQGGQCIEVITFSESLAPQEGVCTDATPLLIDVTSLPVATRESGFGLARSGVGVRAEDFPVWYEDTALWGENGGFPPGINNYQKLIWAAPETAYSDGTTNIGVLELPKPRNSIVKMLMDIGQTRPPRNDNALKVAGVTEVTEALIENDGKSTYIFYSEKLRPDVYEWLEAAMGGWIEMLGSVRAENYSHHLEYPDSSKILNELAFERGNLDAKSCWNPDGDYFYSAGRGGGFAGMNEGDFQNNSLRIGVRNSETGECESLIQEAPIRTFDASYHPRNWSWRPGDWSDAEGPLLVDSTASLTAETRTGNIGHPCSVRECYFFGFAHEYFHDWENHHEIAYPDHGPSKGLPNNQHGLSTELTTLFLTYVFSEQEYDGAEDIIDIRDHDKLLIEHPETAGEGIPNLNRDYAEAFRTGDYPSVERDMLWTNFLRKNYGLNKIQIEYYRRKAFTGDWRIALHQVTGKHYLELYEEADKWIKSLSSWQDFRDEYESAEDLINQLGVSFNVSLLQARNESTPQNHYRTIYTPAHAIEADQVGSEWIPVNFDGVGEIIFEDGAEAVVTRSPSGQLQVNGHDAYYFQADASVFHAGGLAHKDWAAFTRYGERTSDLWFPVFIYDHDTDGLPDDYDPDYQRQYFDTAGRYLWDVWPIATATD